MIKCFRLLSKLDILDQIDLRWLKIYCSLLENINCILASFIKLILNWLIEFINIDSSETRPPYNPNENMSKVSGLLWEKTVWSCINLMTYYIQTKFSQVLSAKWEWKKLDSNQTVNREIETRDSSD